MHLPVCGLQALQAKDSVLQALRNEFVSLATSWHQLPAAFDFWSKAA